MIHLYPLTTGESDSPVAECGATGLRHGQLIDDVGYARCHACLLARSRAYYAGIATVDARLQALREAAAC